MRAFVFVRILLLFASISVKSPAFIMRVRFLLKEVFTTLSLDREEDNIQVYIVL